MFLSSDQRVRSAHFDTLLAQTGEALQHPKVLAELGAVALVLTDLNEQAYLPNMRHGQAQIPRRYREQHGRVAVLPISDEELDNVYELTDPYAKDFGPPRLLHDLEFSMPHAKILSFSELYDRLREEPPGPTSLSTPNEDLNEREGERDAVAGTLQDIRIDHSPKQGPIVYATSRPIIVVRRSITEDLDGFTKAGVLAHEYGHVDFVSQYGLPSFSRAGAASSELFGYHITNTLCELSDSETGVKSLAAEVEALRASQTTRLYPYVANQELVSKLVDLKLI